MIISKNNLLASVFVLFLLALVALRLPGPDFGLFLISASLAYVALLIMSREGYINRAPIFTVLVSLVIFTLYLNYLSPSSPGIQKRTGERIGIERVLDIQFKQGINKLDSWQQGVFPNREKYDDVPESMQTNTGTLETTVYWLDQDSNFVTVSETIFGGGLKAIQIMPKKWFMPILAALLLFIGMGIWFKRTKLTLTLIASTSVFASMRLSNGWDELFINLRHAYMLVTHGVYSINHRSMIEASVDSISLLATAFLAKLGLDLIDAFIIMSLLGNVLVIIFSYLIVYKITDNVRWSLASALFVGIYPNVLWVGASGFSAVLFTGWILAASYYMLFTEKRLLGLILLGTLTLVRTEGVLFAFLLMTYLYIFSGKWKSNFKETCIDGTIVAMPFLISYFIRKLIYGYGIPNPVAFKSTGFDSGYFSAGLARFKEMVVTHDVHIFLVIVLLLLLACFVTCWRRPELKSWRDNTKKLLVLTMITFIFILPYYAGGGDWFPYTWNRYGMPFNLALILSFMVLLHSAFKYGIENGLRTASLATFCLAMVLAYQGSASFHRDSNIQRTWKRIDRLRGGFWDRIDHLASVGFFLNETVPADAIVASPEVATIMYFSEHEMLDLLGVGNPEIAAMPLQPRSRGDILHRKRGYKSIATSKPDVIVFYEPAASAELAENKNKKQEILTILNKELLSPGNLDVIYYRAGSPQFLYSQGYRHTTVAYRDKVLSIFVNKSVLEHFENALISKKFVNLGIHEIPYTINAGLSAKYMASMEDM